MEGRGALVRRLAVARAVFDSTVMCTFPSGLLGLRSPVALVNAVTGGDLTLTQAGADALANNGTILIGTGNTFTVSGGSLSARCSRSSERCFNASSGPTPDV